MQAVPVAVLNALSVTTFPIYPGLGQALDNAGLQTQWLSSHCTLTNNP